MGKNKVKSSVIELNYTDIETNQYQWTIAVLPWGAIEPHGEHLPYTTDTILATAVAKESISKAYKLYGDNRCMMLPSLSLGIQNKGQTDKKFCINFSVATQMAVLEDIVKSLSYQNIRNLVIINGHNGNDFKPLVRELSVKYPTFKIYVCDYLSLVNDLMKGNEAIYGIDNFPAVDDHAAFTETSLMMHVFDCGVDKVSMIVNGDWDEETRCAGIENKPHINFWSPRDFNKVSVNNRIGSLKNASKKNGEKIFDAVTNEIAKDLITIQKEFQ